MKKFKMWIGVAVTGMVVLSCFAQEASEIVYAVHNGKAEWPAAGFQARTGTARSMWKIVPDEEPVIDFSSISGLKYSFIQVQPKAKVRTMDAVVEYRVQIDEPGCYEIRYKGAGIDSEADSAFIRIKELSGEFVQLGGTDDRLSAIRWRTAPAVFEVKESGLYTVQVGNREAGYCLLELSLHKM